MKLADLNNKLNTLPLLKVDRTTLSVASLTDAFDEKAYWLSRTPHERLQHIELLRRINYGSRATARLQRVFEVAPLKVNKKASGRHKDLNDLENLL